MNCLEDRANLEIYGDQYTKEQAYVEVTLIPGTQDISKFVRNNYLQFYYLNSYFDIDVLKEDATFKHLNTKL